MCLCLCGGQCVCMCMCMCGGQRRTSSRCCMQCERAGSKRTVSQRGIGLFCLMSKRTVSQRGKRAAPCVCQHAAASERGRAGCDGGGERHAAQTDALHAHATRNTRGATRNPAHPPHTAHTPHTPHTPRPWRLSAAAIPASLHLPRRLPGHLAPGLNPQPYCLHPKRPPLRPAGARSCRTHACAVASACAPLALLFVHHVHACVLRHAGRGA